MTWNGQWSRRDLLSASGMGLMGAACVRALDAEAPPLYRRRGGRRLYQPAAEASTVGLVKGSDRHENIGSVAESMGRIVGETPLPVEEAESGTVPRGIDRKSTRLNSSHAN